jgi:restriction system protein
LLTWGSDQQRFTGGRVAIMMGMGPTGGTPTAGFVPGYFTPHRIKRLPSILLQAVVVPGDKTGEGQLIEAVSLPWFDIIELIKQDPNVVYKIDDRKWEEIIAGAYKRAGFDEVTLTPRSGDFGRDVIAVKRGVGCVRFIDQVKAFGPGHPVPAKDVRALIGVLLSDFGATKGIVTTTSDFAPRLADDPFIKPHIPYRLELVNGTELIKRLTHLSHRP